MDAEQMFTMMPHCLGRRCSTGPNPQLSDEVVTLA